MPTPPDAPTPPSPVDADAATAYTGEATPALRRGRAPDRRFDIAGDCG